MKGIGIAAIVLVRRETGVICLPKFNIIPAALAMTVDLLLDIFLVGRAGSLLKQSDTANRANNRLLVLSSLGLFIWNMVI